MTTTLESTEDDFPDRYAVRRSIAQWAESPYVRVVLNVRRLAEQREIWEANVAIRKAGR